MRQVVREKGAPQQLSPAAADARVRFSLLRPFNVFSRTFFPSELKVSFSLTYPALNYTYISFTKKVVLLSKPRNCDDIRSAPMNGPSLSRISNDNNEKGLVKKAIKARATTRKKKTTSRRTGNSLDKIVSSGRTRVFFFFFPTQ